MKEKGTPEMNLFNEAGQRTKEVIKSRTNSDGSVFVEVGDIVLYKYLETEESLEEMEMEGLSLSEMLARPLKEIVSPAIIYALDGQNKAMLALLTGDATQPLAYLDDRPRGTQVDQWQARS
jgi:hypothetical protein